MRIGQGFDVHPFVEGDHVMLGGVKVPYNRGIDAHSDGDVILHALTDALLGAVALGDIGQHFPSEDEAFKGMSSLHFLEQMYAKVKALGYTLVNADITVVAEAPKLSPYRDTIRETIASALSVEVSAVSVKATTTDKLGFCGRGEGIAAMAVVLLA